MKFSYIATLQQIGYIKRRRQQPKTTNKDSYITIKKMMFNKRFQRQTK